MSKGRTDAKIRYAEAMLRDLQERPGAEGDDFQRAREEAFVFHLHGAIDAFLHEINDHHGCGLAANQVTLFGLEHWFVGSGGISPVLQEIRRMLVDDQTALGRVRVWRHEATHRGGTPRTFYKGGAEDGQRRLKDPTTGDPSGKSMLEEFAEAASEMRTTIRRLRAMLAATRP